MRWDRRCTSCSQHLAGGSSIRFYLRPVIEFVCSILAIGMSGDLDSVDEFQAARKAVELDSLPIQRHQPGAHLRSLVITRALRKRDSTAKHSANNIRTAVIYFFWITMDPMSYHPSG